MRLSARSLVSTLLLLPAGAIAQPVGPATQSRFAPSPLEGLRDDAPMFSGATYDGEIPTAESILGFPTGERAATPAQLVECFRAWDGKGPDGARARLFTHGETWEGRPLVHMVIASPERMRNIDALLGDIARLADPRGMSKAEHERLANSLPPVAWMAYSIHGDETSGADASLALAHYLVAGTDQRVQDLLRDVVVVIDPIMNPDGRDRFLKMIAENRAASPNVDDQALLHTGYWPFGRMNHYLFDLNRDWIFATQPETRGRIEAVRRWRPQLFLDAHEMGSQDSFLCSPSREPSNPHHPAGREEQMTLLARAIARDFDASGWRLYTGEWNEGWYPGYSDAWATFGGAIGMLFEQAGVAEDGVRRLEGAIEPYRTSVRKQATASLSILLSLRERANAVMLAYAAERRAAAAGEMLDGRPRAWIIDGSADRTRLARLIDALHVQGVEIEQTRAGFTAESTDRFGRRAERDFPDGSYLVRLAQPEGHLACALLDLDPRMTTAFLQEERREILRFGRSRLYDTTAWSLPMMFDVPAWALDAAPDVPTAPVTALPAGAAPTLGARSSVGWVAPGGSDDTVAFAARLMERGVRVRVALKPTTYDRTAVPRSSVLVLRVDNQSTPGGALDEHVALVAREAGVVALPLPTGLGDGDLPDLGGEHFPLLVQPRIAILARGALDGYSFGETWHAVDQALGVRASTIDSTWGDLGDLRRYNVIIVPDSWGETPLAPGSSARESLRTWVASGGTLIAMGDAAAAATQGGEDDGPLTSARTLPKALEDIGPYERRILREFAGLTESLDEEDAAAAWSHEAPTEGDFPWDDAPETPDAEELKKRDAWSAMFMPQGAFVAGRVDDRHFLTLGLADEMPVLCRAGHILMAADGVDAPIRMGVFEEAPADDADDADAGDDEAKSNENDTRRRIGWSTLPEDTTLRLRAAGLLWPEAAARLANSAAVTREGVGRGQVILFPSSPNFRAATLGSRRVLLNAIVYGPGCGTSPAIIP